MTTPQPNQVPSPFKGSCLAHIASIASGFASAMEGMSNPLQMELAAVQYLAQLLAQHLQSHTQPAISTPVQVTEAQPEQVA